MRRFRRYRSPLLASPGLLLGLALALLLPACGSSDPAPAAEARAQEPPPRAYALRHECNLPIEMDDGTVLRANVTRPDAPGRFPTILSMTVYNKDVRPGVEECAAGATALTGNSAHLAPSGYAVMTVDVRGAGSSGGDWDVFGARSRRDSAGVLDWIQAQPWSDGKVGATGCSALGIGTLHTVLADEERVRAGKPRALYAAWADAGFPDLYRDVFGNAGNGQSGAALAPFGLYGAGTLLGPLANARDPASLGALGQGVLPLEVLPVVTDHQLGGDRSYDGPWYRERSTVDRAGEIRIPVAVTANLQDFDAVLRGTATFFRGMTASQKPLLVLHPGGHCQTALDGYAQLGHGDRNATLQHWFDRWLRGRRNGIERLPAVNVFPQNGERWIQGETWPLPDSRLRAYYLAAEPSGTARSLNDGSLRLQPRAVDGRDTLPFQPLSGLCSASSTSVLGFVAGVAPGTDLGPCARDNRVNELSALSYTTEAFAEELLLAGPVTAELWATLSGRDGTLVATLSDVAPDGRSTGLAVGWLRASHRALDEARTLRDREGRVIQPYHPFTREAQQPVVPGEEARYLIELVPAVARIAPGHRLRLTVTPADTPAIQPSLAQTRDSAPTLTIVHGPQRPSQLLVSVVERRRDRCSNGDAKPR